MAYYYLKLYHEILDDPKMGRLPDHLWRRTIEMFLIASLSIERDGYLPSVEDMAWKLRSTPDELLQDLEQIAKVGIVRQVNGRWHVTNFVKRQSAVPGAERTKRYRERMQIDAVCDKNSDESCDESSQSRQTELRVKVKDRDREGASAPNDDFGKMQALIEELTGFPVLPNPENINTIDEFIRLEVTADDIRDALQFLGNSGKLARGPIALRGSVLTARGKRIQKSNAKPAQKPYIPEEHATEVY